MSSSKSPAETLIDGSNPPTSPDDKEKAITATPKNKAGRSLWMRHLHKGVTDSDTADDKSSPYKLKDRIRKWQRKPDEWKPAQIKRNKNLGLEYKDTLGCKVCGRNVKPVTCKCKFKCSRKFDFITQR